MTAERIHCKRCGSPSIREFCWACIRWLEEQETPYDVPGSADHVATSECGPYDDWYCACGYRYPPTMKGTIARIEERELRDLDNADRDNSEMVR